MIQLGVRKAFLRKIWLILKDEQKLTRSQGMVECTAKAFQEEPPQEKAL